MVFQQNLLEKTYFIAKMSGLTMVRPASSDFWKAPLENVCFHWPLRSTLANEIFACVADALNLLYNALDECVRRLQRRLMKFENMKLHNKEVNAKKIIAVTTQLLQF